MTKSDKILIISSIIVVLAIVAAAAALLFFNKMGVSLDLPKKDNAGNSVSGGETPGGNGPGVSAGETGDGDSASHYTDMEAKECTGKETKMDDTFFIEYTAQNMYLSQWAMKYTGGQAGTLELAARMKTFKAAVPVFCVNDAAFEEYQNGIIENPEKFEPLMTKVQGRVLEFESQFGKVYPE